MEAQEAIAYKYERIAPRHVLGQYLELYDGEHCIMQHPLPPGRTAQVVIVVAQGGRIPSSVPNEVVVVRRRTNNMCLSCQVVDIVIDVGRVVGRVTDRVPAQPRKYHGSQRATILKAPCGRIWGIPSSFFASSRVPGIYMLRQIAWPFLRSVQPGLSLSELLIKFVDYCKENCYRYEADTNGSNNKPGDFGNSKLEEYGVGDCEDIAHFYVRAVQSLSFVETMETHGHSELKKLFFDYTPLLIGCYSSPGDNKRTFHCIAGFAKKGGGIEDVIFVDGTTENSSNTVFIGHHKYIENNYGQLFMSFTDLYMDNCPYTEEITTKNVRPEFFNPRIPYYTDPELSPR
jgi:hypothetical protein